MKISQLADRTGVSIRSIRHYEKKGLLQISRLANNYREFDESSVDTVRTIQLYLGLGLTTDQIKDIMYCEYPEILEADENKGEYCEELLQVYEKKRNEIIKQRKTLDEAQQKLEMQIDLLKSNRENLID
ncbi:MerR family transcriptional regulator [Paenibacillus nasutitermitis]|uniref:MerR family transcriptional regulator n=1 Tax=Paenibacillus nasutitermitis TaxID=1652958 RepID=A0A917DMJ6_9BACL|nr:MerR family transcriptional regulator [Paenibacillus nasutitermitis]GGD52871.1 MerR family transcriptional regulator [Paenibacillus nasutitermitis]